MFNASRAGRGAEPAVAAGAGEAEPQALSLASRGQPERGPRARGRWAEADGSSVPRDHETATCSDRNTWEQQKM